MIILNRVRKVGGLKSRARWKAVVAKTDVPREGASASRCFASSHASSLEVLDSLPLDSPPPLRGGLPLPNAANGHPAVNLLHSQTLNDLKLEVENEHILSDVFEKAASYGVIPTIEYTHSKPSEPFQASITIPIGDKDLTAIGIGTTAKLAEIAAALCILRRTKILELTKSISATNPLNRNNCGEFLRFYRKRRKTTLKTKISCKAASKINTVRLDGQTLAAIPYISESSKSLATLAASIKISQLFPHTLQEFHEMAKAKAKASEADRRAFGLSPTSEQIVQKTLEEAKKQGLGSLQDDENTINDSELGDVFDKQTLPSELSRKARSARLFRGYQTHMTTPRMKAMREKRDDLPINQHRVEILNLVESNPYSIIVGATGSGKTTQVPQIIFDHEILSQRGGDCKIICTQPRRIAATSVARRVAEERGAKVGQSIGYITKGAVQVPHESGSITFCTTGVLLAQLKSDPDYVFDSVSHILVDEVHERNMLVDFLLVLLRTTGKARRQAGKRVPHVVLMSATVDTNLFSKYLGRYAEDGCLIPCPSVSVPGRLYPVTHRYLSEILKSMAQTHSPDALSLLQSHSPTKKYLEREMAFKLHASVDGNGLPDSSSSDNVVPSSLIALIIAHVTCTTDHGSILVFLPGQKEILDIKRILVDQSPLGVNFSNSTRFLISTLHSTTPQEEQAAVFNSLPAGCRRIILSTNIAETSITIPHVQHVVDSGKLREKQYGHDRNIDALLCTWASQANCKQRAGRAGRVQHGNYYAAFTEERMNSLAITGLPEIMRSDLQSTCLSIKSYEFPMSIKQFLSEAIEPPSSEAIDNAIERLQALGGLNDDESLTPLGQALTNLNIEPSWGKMILMGLIFRCFDSMVILAAMNESTSLFQRPMEKRQEAKRAFAQFLDDTKSEHIAALNAFKRLQDYKRVHGLNAAYSWARKNFVSMATYLDIERTCKTLEDTLLTMGIMPKSSPEESRLRGIAFGSLLGDVTLNENSSQLPLIRALLLSGLLPNLGIHKNTKNPRAFRTASEKKVFVQMGSILADIKGQEIDYNGAMVTFSTLTKGDSAMLCMRDVTEVTPLMAILFGGPLTRDQQGYTIGGWLKFSDSRVDTRVNQANSPLIELRIAFDKILQNIFSSLSVHRVNTPQRYLADTPLHKAIIRGIVSLLSHDVNNLRMEMALSRGGHSEMPPLKALKMPYEIFWGRAKMNVTWGAEHPAENNARESCENGLRPASSIPLSEISVGAGHHADQTVQAPTLDSKFEDAFQNVDKGPAKARYVSF